MPAPDKSTTFQNAPLDEEKKPIEAPDPELAKPGEAVLTEERRKYILDGDKKGNGGHGTGRNKPDKSEFPPRWSDEEAIEAVKEVANDPASVRSATGEGRTKINGTRDGIDIEIIIGADRKTIVTAYPTNTERNPK